LRPKNLRKQHVYAEKKNSAENVRLITLEIANEVNVVDEVEGRVEEIVGEGGEEIENLTAWVAAEEEELRDILAHLAGEILGSEDHSGHPPENLIAMCLVAVEVPDETIEEGRPARNLDHRPMQDQSEILARHPVEDVPLQDPVLLDVDLGHPTGVVGTTEAVGEDGEEALITHLVGDHPHPQARPVLAPPDLSNADDRPPVQ
jgi:hypothetical protein